jgi:alpha-tubulin suppressor-like RCC1 family protein
VALALACSSGGRPATDGPLPVDASADATTSADAATDGVCTCGAQQFCTVTGKCVSAVKQVAAGTVHTCAVHADGKVSCWGYGAVIGPRVPALTPPVTIEMPERATAVAVGIQAACALLESGRVDCWGDLGKGAEGPAPVTREDGAPLDQVKQIAGGSVAFCAVGGTGTHCWGENKASELARPASMTFPPLTAVMVLPNAPKLIAATVAILVHDGAQLCGWGDNDSGVGPGARGVVERPACAPTPPPAFLQLTAGDGHACAWRGGASFSCWGSNAGGQLGNGDETMMDVALPGAVQALPAEITALAAGAYHTCALARGAAYCWGSNEQGECGSPSSAPIFKPTAVPGVRSRAVAIGAGAGAQHTCVVLDDGSVSCWGSDSDGQLGSGATSEDTSRFSPEPVAVRW